MQGIVNWTDTLVRPTLRNMGSGFRNKEIGREGMNWVYLCQEPKTGSCETKVYDRQPQAFLESRIYCLHNKKDCLKLVVFDGHKPYLSHSNTQLDSRSCV
jgi:hypothetical protein